MEEKEYNIYVNANVTAVFPIRAKTVTKAKSILAKRMERPKACDYLKTHIKQINEIRKDGNYGFIQQNVKETEKGNERAEAGSMGFLSGDACKAFSKSLQPEKTCECPVTFDRLLDIFHHYVLNDMKASEFEYVRDALFEVATVNEIKELGFERMFEGEI